MNLNPTTEDKLIYAELLEEKLRLQDELPHLHGWDWYDWAWDYFHATEKNQFICAANQISKSSTQIRKCIELACNKTLWPKYWDRKPTQFWYLFTSLDVGTIEVTEKWVKEFLPRGTMKDHEWYGWKLNKQNKKVYSLEFNSGVTIYFKSFEQDIKNLQSSSVFYIFADEEMPVEMYDEINVRRIAVDGYFSMAFTATLGQAFWRDTIEGEGENERFKGAFKRQVSMYDCLYYRNGKRSHWTRERIQTVIDSCQSEAEILRRVYGKFVVDTGLVYGSFVRSKNFKTGHDVTNMIKAGWTIWTGVDVGSGGKTGHPAAICFIIVNPTFTKGRVFKFWRGDNVETTAGDVHNHYLKMRGELQPVSERYDWASKDFFTIAARSGKSAFQQADKSQERGQQLLNTLFKNGQLIIYKDAESEKLAYELESLRTNTPKRVAKDDGCDSLRYAATVIPWKFTDELEEPEKEEKNEKLNSRMAFYSQDEQDQLDQIFGDETEMEIEILNEMMEW